MEFIDKILKNKIFIIFTILIIIIGILIRIQLLSNQGFFEPDGFYHFAVIRAAINNNFQIPKTLTLSGAPVNPEITEPYGLYWVTLIPYFFLRFLGISYYDIFRLIPVLFGILDIIGAYYLSRFLSKNKFFGLLVMFFVAVSLGNVSKTLALVYRGDAFVSIFLIVSLIFILKIFQENNRYKKILYAIFSGISLSFGSLVWNGASFAILVYIIGFLALIVFGYILNNKDMFKKSFYLIFGLGIWFLLVLIYQALSFIKSSNQALLGLSFITLYLLIIVFYAILYAFDRFNFFKTRKIKTLAIFGLILFGSLTSVILLQGLINRIFINNGFFHVNSFFSSIEELLPPTYNFTFISFNIVVFLTPMSIFIVLGTIFQNYSLIFWIISIISFMPFLFMKIDSDGTWFDSKLDIKESITPYILILAAYFTITSYLLISGIRFSSLFSIPLAIFSAYSIYWLVNFIINKNIGLDELQKKSKRYMVAPLAFLIFIIIIVLYLTTVFYHVNVSDGINNQTLNGIKWLSSNTPTNSVILTLWTEGSIVEGWGNRTSIIDSVGSQNVIKINTVYNWLINDNNSAGIFYNESMGSPNYLLVRYYWMNFLPEIYNTLNISNKMYIMNYKNINSNFNGTKYEFSDPSYKTTTLLEPSNKNNTIFPIGRFINSTGTYNFSSVEFYNVNNSYITQVNYTNGTYYAIVLYSNDTIKNKTIGISPIGVYVLSKNVFYSNIIKVLYECNQSVCIFDNKSISLKLVYMNPDMKIFEIERR